MNDFIINLHQAQGPTIPMSIPLLGGMPASSFAGSFLGVFLAILLGVILDFLRKDSSRFKHRQMLYDEIKKGIEIIIENKALLPGCHSLSEPIPIEKIPSIIPIDSWNSSIYSGALRLLSIKEIAELIRLYDLINKYNIEIGKYRDTKLDRVAFNNLEINDRVAWQRACRSYENVIFPKYCDDLLAKMEEFNRTSEPRVTKRLWKVWRYIF